MSLLIRILKRTSPFVLLAALILVGAGTHAADFVVTSNADVGPGTLRAALAATAANGNASADRILFNLPGATEADFTIIVNTQLPDVSSNLVIDGTSQPGNVIRGTVNTHVVIKSIIQPLNDMDIFKGDGIHDLEIYGLLMWDTNLPTSTDPNRPGRNGIALINAERITIGKAGKGNWFDGYNQQSISIIDCRTVSIVANTFHRRVGNRDPGESAPIFLQRIVGLNFGEAGAGNVLFTGVFISLANIPEVSKLVFIDNNFAVEADGKTTTMRGTAGIKIVGGDIDPTNPNSLVDILLTGNLFTHYQDYGIRLDFLKGKAVIKHNWFGTDRSATLQLNYNRADPYGGMGTGLGVTRFLGDVQVGDADPAQANVFANSEYGVSIAAITNVLVMRNAFQCISKGEFDSGNEDIPITTLVSSTLSAISGTAAPGATVDLFSTDECTTRCSPFKLIATTQADAAGLWHYTYANSVNGYVTANSHIGKRSSNFTQITINTDQVKVMNVQCGQLGAIKNIRVSNTTSYKWLDRDGKVVSTLLDLVDVPPGSYKLVAGDYCSSETMFFDIQDYNARINEAYRRIQQPFCDSKTGSIMGLIINQNYADPVSLRWVDASQNTVGTAIDLQNVGAGTYFLKLKTASGCETTYGPVVLTALSVPSTGAPLTATTTGVFITPDDCGGATGGVKGVQVSGGLAPYKFNWTDAQGQTVGAQQALTSAKAGTYTLTIDADDKAPCSRVVLSFDVPARDVVLTAPAVAQAKICGPGAAVLRVINVVKGTYKLYNTATSTVPLKENTTGVFIENVSVNTTYYIAVEVGWCSSARVPAVVHVVGSGVDISNSFTPNNDGVNDTWQITNINEYPNVTVRVFNRAGAEVYRSRGYNYPFTGKANNKMLPVGVYYYLIDLGTGCAPFSGALTLLR